MGRSLCLAGAIMILVPAQRPLSRIDNFRDLVKVRILKNQLFVAAANSSGPDRAGTEMGGHSLVPGPRGTILGRLDAWENFLPVEVGTREVGLVSERFPVLSWRPGHLPVRG